MHGTEITIDISADGNTVTVEGHGELGPDCKTLTKDIEQALGEATLKQTKPEFRRPPTHRLTKTV